MPQGEEIAGCQWGKSRSARKPAVRKPEKAGRLFGARFHYHPGCQTVAVTQQSGCFLSVAAGGGDVGVPEACLCPAV